ncbi:unnamed protein product [Ophioblennius macclurei]
MELQPTSDTPPEPPAVFVSGRVYRVPSLFYEREKKILLAFVEERRTPNDRNAKKLLMSRGKLKDTDGKKQVEWSHPEPVKEAKMDGYRPMNPCPVYDKKSGTLFLFFICIEGTFSDWDQIDTKVSRTRLCFITSKDFGETWLEFTNLSIVMSEIKAKWVTFAVGPGHGFQTEEGRLIVPFHGFHVDGTRKDTYACSLYSDDSGETWHFGTELESRSDECEMAEFFDEDKSLIYCNARSQRDVRVEALSGDKGEHFEILTVGPLVETASGCQGSVIAFPDPNKNSDRNKWLLFSHPTDKNKRTDLGVYLNKSPRNPNAWSKPFVICKGPSGYSDLAYVGGGWFVCLLECGKVEAFEQIACKVLHFSEIEKHCEQDDQSDQRCCSCELL